MMQKLDRDEVVRVVHTSPDAVYRLVSDVTRTPEYSPEVVQCTWEDGATGPVVGARFAAQNNVGRGPAWTNHPVVTVAEPGRAFAVSRTEKGAGTVVWRGDLEPHPEGTLVRESYDVTSPVKRFGWFIIGTLYGLKDRRSGLRANMEASLARLAAVVEAAEIKHEKNRARGPRRGCPPRSGLGRRTTTGGPRYLRAVRAHRNAVRPLTVAAGADRRVPPSRPLKARLP